MNYIDQDFDALEIPRNHAPTREQIAAVNDVSTLWDMISDATDIEISIKTQLEYLEDDIDLRRRRVAALIFWRQACKNMKSRINGMAGAAARQKVIP